MKSAIALAFLLAAICLPRGLRAADQPAPDLKAAQQFSELVRKADSVSVPVYDEKKKEAKSPLTIRDHAWIEQFSQILERAVFVPALPIFAITEPIIFRDNGGRTLLGIEVFSTHLCLDGRFYEVGENTCAEIGTLLQKKR